MSLSGGYRRTGGCAANNLSPGGTTIAGSATFDGLLASQTWDVVALDVPSTAPASGWAGLINYVNGGGRVVLSYWDWDAEASLASDWAALNPSADEIAALKKAGFAVTEVSPSAFRRDVHADKVVLLPFYYGFHVGMEVSADDVYRFLKVVEKNVAALAKSDPGFSQIAADMAGMQRKGVEAAANLVEIHPGLARYMREKGVWDAKWDSRVAK